MEELGRYKVPRSFNVIGIGMGGPTVMQWGVRGDEDGRCCRRWRSTARSGASCSASRRPVPTSRRSPRVRCATATNGSSTVRRCGRRWRTWREWGMLVARTDPDAPKHKGLTYFIVDMHAPGVEVRPLQADHRRRRVQRGVLHRRAHSRLDALRRRRQRVGGGDRDADERARRAVGRRLHRWRQRRRRRDRRPRSAGEGQRSVRA